jgi:putative transposase
VICLAVMTHIRFPLSLRNVKNMLREQGVDICHESVRCWWNQFAPTFAREIRKKRIHAVIGYSGWRCHLDEMFVKIYGELHYLLRPVDHEGEVLEAFVSKRIYRFVPQFFFRNSMNLGCCICLNFPLP